MKSSNCICIWSPQLKLVCVHLQILDLTKGAWLNELMLRHLPPSPFPLSTWAGIFSLQRLEVLGWVCQQLALLKKLSKFLFLISINIKDSLIVFGWKVSANKEKKWLPEWKFFRMKISFWTTKVNSPLLFNNLFSSLHVLSLSLSLNQPLCYFLRQLLIFNFLNFSFIHGPHWTHQDSTL